MLLNGTGGIGKTTLAIEYLNKYQNFYDHLGFVEYNNDIKNSFLSAFVNTYKLNTETVDERFEELLYNLQNLDGKNLLIIDDIKRSDDFEMIKNLSVNFELLITSRTEFNTVNKLDIEHLPIEKAKELFLDYFNTNENIDILLEYLDYHTLFIKLTAQTLANSRILTIKKIEQKFKNGEFGDIKNNLVQSTFNIYLEKFFDLSNLSKNEVLILKKLSLFPSIEIDFEKLKDFLCIEDKEEFDSSLTILSKNGWLIQNKNTFKLHQIIKEFLLSFHHILYEECESIVQYFANKLLLNPTDDAVYKFEYLPFSISIVNNLKDENEDIATLINNISLICIDIGNYQEALNFQLRAIDLTKKVFGEKHQNLASSYNNISMIYKNIGKFEESISFGLESLKLREELMMDVPSIVVSYNNISMIYQDIGKLEEALSFSLDSLSLVKQISENEQPNLYCSIYNTISMIYKEMNDLPNALEYQLNAIELVKKILGFNHSSLGMNYNNISLIYKDLGKFDEALEYQLKSLSFKVKLGENHPSLAITYNNLGLIYQGLKDWNISLEFYKKALVIAKERLNKNHPILATIYANIAQIYFKNSNLVEAKIAIDKAENIYKELFPTGHYKLDEILKIKKIIYQSN